VGIVPHDLKSVVKYITIYLDMGTIYGIIVALIVTNGALS